MQTSIGTMEQLTSAAAEMTRTTHRLAIKKISLLADVEDLRDAVANFDDSFRPIRNYFPGGLRFDNERFPTRHETFHPPRPGHVSVKSSCHSEEDQQCPFYLQQLGRRYLADALAEFGPVNCGEILSTMMHLGIARPFVALGCNSIRSNGMSVASVVSGQRVMESVASNRSSCTTMIGRGFPAFPWRADAVQISPRLTGCRNRLR